MATRTRELRSLNPTVRDFFSAVIWGFGAGPPVDATSSAAATGQGEAGTGSLYVDTTNGDLYKNTGTKAVPVWNQVGGVAASEIVLAEGFMLLGNSSGVGVATEAATDKGIMVGDGTTAVNVQVSGDVTMANTGAVTIAAGAVEESMLAAASLTGLVAKVVATENVIGGLLQVIWFSVDGGANADQSITLTHKSKVIDFIVRLDGAGTSGADVALENAGTEISNVIDISSGGDEDVFRPAELNNAQVDVAAAAVLTVATTSTGGDCPALQVFVTVMRVA